jgi:hypothetical protein
MPAEAVDEIGREVAEHGGEGADPDNDAQYPANEARRYGEARIDQDDR